MQKKDMAWQSLTPVFGFTRSTQGAVVEATCEGTVTEKDVTVGAVGAVGSVITTVCVVASELGFTVPEHCKLWKVARLAELTNKLIIGAASSCDRNKVRWAGSSKTRQRSGAASLLETRENGNGKQEEDGLEHYLKLKRFDSETGTWLRWPVG